MHTHQTRKAWMSEKTISCYCPFKVGIRHSREKKRDKVRRRIRTDSGRRRGTDRRTWVEQWEDEKGWECSWKGVPIFLPLSASQSCQCLPLYSLCCLPFYSLCCLPLHPSRCLPLIPTDNCFSFSPAVFPSPPPADCPSPCPAVWPSPPPTVCPSTTPALYQSHCSSLCLLKRINEKSTRIWQSRGLADTVWPKLYRSVKCHLS